VEKGWRENGGGEGVSGYKQKMADRFVLFLSAYIYNPGISLVF
jgi:hypothetical protein